LLNVALKQINIAPTASNYIGLVAQANFYELYRVKKVYYRFVPVVTTSLGSTTSATSQIPIAFYFRVT